MDQKLRRVLSVAVGAIALGLTAIGANAQQATFHLPFQAHWGSADLEPGDYKLSSTLGVSGTYLIELHGPGKSSAVVPSVTQFQPSTSRSYLKLEEVNGTYYVTKYQVASTGTAFYFGHPKIAKSEARTSQVAARSIPVENTGGTR